MYLLGLACTFEMNEAELIQLIPILLKLMVFLSNAEWILEVESLEIIVDIMILNL